MNTNKLITVTVWATLAVIAYEVYKSVIVAKAAATPAQITNTGNTDFAAALANLGFNQAANLSGSLLDAGELPINNLLNDSAGDAALQETELFSF